MREYHSVSLPEFVQLPLDTTALDASFSALGI
jgi:hypothetical protein